MIVLFSEYILLKKIIRKVNEGKEKQMISIPINCTGCTTCVTSCPKQCIKMKKSIEGFLYPSVEQDNCINCGICEKVCPVLSKVETHNKIKAFAMKN